MFSPSLGLSLIASLLIVGVSMLIRRLRSWWMNDYPRQTPIATNNVLTRTVAVLLVLVVGMLYVSTFIVALFYAMHHQDSHILALEQRTTNCEPFVVNLTDKNVILRLDDVQSGAWTDISIRMMKDALGYGMPVVAGVIPKDIATNHVLLRFLWQQHCNIEVALHGYDHAGGSDYDVAVGEFGVLDKATAEQKIKAGVGEVREAVYTTLPIVTFIPPQNNISPAAAAVLQTERFLVLSKEGIGPYDYDAKTWNYQEDTLIEATTIMTDCDETFAAGDPLCVIMLHPQDFATTDGSLDLEKYRQYQTLLTLLSHTNTSVVRFSDVSSSQLLFDKGGE